MHRRRLFGFFTLLLTAAALLVPLVALAQSGQASEIVVAYPEAIAFPGQNGLTLRLYFTLVDGNRRPVVAPPILNNKATYSMLDRRDGGPYEASVEKAGGPIEVVLVLDISGSMGRELPIMQKAAIDLTQKLPREARFTMIVFNNAINVLQDSTDDRNRLANAIGAIPQFFQQGGGTCLYDATFKGLETLALSGNRGRRAVVVFTDGVEQKSASDRSACSVKTIGDVLQLATNKDFRVPIYTIGFRGAPNDPLDEAGLRSMAESTGGIVSIGGDLTILFNDINNAFEAQLMAEALIQPCKGDRQATMGIVLTDGRTLNPVGFVFNSPDEFCFKEPTVTPTFTPSATPPPVSFNPIAPAYQPDQRAYVVEIRGIVSENQVKEYVAELFSGGSVVQRRTVPAPVKEPIVIPVPPDLPAQDLTIRVSAFSADGRALFTRDQVVRYAPTAVPTATFTPTIPPIGVRIDAVRYTNPQLKDEIQLDLSFSQREKIARLDFKLFENTTLIIDLPALPVTSPLPISLKGLTAGEYRIVLRPLDNGGQQVGDLFETPFKHTVQPTAVPTNTPTSTFTPSPSARLLPAIDVNLQAGTITFGIEPTNPGLIDSYRIELINKDTSVRVRELVVEVVDPTKLTIPLENLPGGTYTARLRGLDSEGRAVTDVSEIPFIFNPPPPTATPTLEPTFTPSPTATPEPNDLVSRISRILQNPQQAPIVLGIFGVMALGLILLFVVLLRPRKRGSTGTGFLAEMTGAVEIPKPKPDTKRGAAPAAATKRSQRPDETQIEAAEMDERTSAVPHLMMPPASLTVENTRHAPMLGKTLPITHTPFTLGRKSRDANFDNDDNVSREHAQIVFENGNFYVVDMNSTHGTHVDEQRIAAGERVAIYDNSQIRLGTTTVLRLSVAGSGYGDMDKTGDLPGMRK